MATNEKNTPNIADLEMLTPGSVWIRKEGKQSRFLFLTNSTLPADLQKRYPQTAVYADENDNVFSVPVAEFISKRTFFNVSPELETRLDNLLAFDTKVDNSEFDLLNNDADTDDSLLIDDSDEQQGEDGDEGEYEKKADITPNPSQNMFPVSFFAGGTGLPEIISSQLLSECTECYQQTPQVASKALLHTLFIRAHKGITLEGLQASFDPANVEKNAVFMFKVQTAVGLLEVDWDSFVGVFQYVFQNVPMYQVVFQTGIDFNYAYADVAFDTVDPVVQTATSEALHMIGSPTPEAQEPSPIVQTGDGSWAIAPDNTVLAVSAG